MLEDLKDHKVFLVPKVFKDLKVLEDLKVLKVPEGHKDHKVLKVI